MGRHYAGILGLLAFLVCLVRGIAHGGGAEGTVTMAVLSLMAFAAIGFVVGTIADSVVRDAIAAKMLAEIESRQAAKK